MWKKFGFWLGVTWSVGIPRGVLLAYENTWVSNMRQVK